MFLKQKLQSRKFWSAWILTLLSSYLLWHGKILDTTFSTILIFIWGFYFSVDAYKQKLYKDVKNDGDITT